jgi:hypothetical protein
VTDVIVSGREADELLDKGVVFVCDLGSRCVGRSVGKVGRVRHTTEVGETRLEKDLRRN